MIPNLVEATQEYWLKLDELEAAYQKGEISIEEVDRQVASLIKELGRKRQSFITYFLQSWQHFFSQQKETIVGLAMLGIICYFWLRL
jgi:hypothetical protein